jgi:hypothetical protein
VILSFCVALLSSKAASTSGARLLIKGPSSTPSYSFESAFYVGPPILALPPSISFDNTSAVINSITISLVSIPSADIEGISFSTLGTLHTTSIALLSHLTAAYFVHEDDHLFMTHVILLMISIL